MARGELVCVDYGLEQETSGKKICNLPTSLYITT